MNEIKIFAPASVANVSCAFDILGFSLNNIGDEMVFRKRKEKGVSISVSGYNSIPLEPEKNVAGVVALNMLKENNNFGVNIEIKKNIKPGSGLGSSAASASGTAFGINKLLNNIYNEKELVEFAMTGEALASGVEHADNVAPALLGNFVLVRSLNPLDFVKIKSPTELFCTVLHPLIEVKTIEARKILNKTVDLQKAIMQWGNVAGLISGLFTSDYDLIGRSLKDHIIEPQRAVLIPDFYALRNGAIKAGAMGCGISGSGPAVFALSKGESIAQRVKLEMEKAYQQTNIKFDTYVSRINDSGVRII